MTDINDRFDRDSYEAALEDGVAHVEKLEARIAALELALTRMVRTFGRDALVFGTTHPVVIDARALLNEED